MTGDSSENVGISIAGWGASFPTSSGSGTARATKALAYYTKLMLRLQQQQAILARKQWEFSLRSAYPESPVYGPLTPVVQWDIPVKLTSKQTAINQRLMAPGLSTKKQVALGVSQRRIAARIETYKAKHPEAATTVLARRN